MKTEAPGNVQLYALLTSFILDIESSEEEQIGVLRESIVLCMVIETEGDV